MLLVWIWTGIMDINGGVDEHTSDDPESEFYHGKEPFSEKETQAKRDLLHK